MNTDSRTTYTLVACAILIACTLLAAAQNAVPVSTDVAGLTGDHASSKSQSTLTISRQPSPRSAAQSTGRSRGPLTENEMLSGVNLTEDQKAAIDQIHRSMRTKMEIVAKDENETPEQKGAMLEGLNRMQLRQVFEVLKPDQRAEVRKKVNAMRSANQQESESQLQKKAH